MTYGTLNVDSVVSSDGTTASGLYGFKNRIINGAMMIDQRNAGASVTPTDGSYTIDRYLFRVSQASKLTCQQSSTAPVGFKNSLLVTSSSAYSVGSGDFFAIEQRIEGYNVSDMGFGTANAATVTFSFWVRSSLTGTFGGAFANGAFDRCYPFTYTINAANTWEQKTVTIVGDTSGTWATDSSTGFKVQFGLGVGSTYSAASGSWQTTTAWSATGATSVVGTSGATFYITGVQLEKGSTATSFDYRPYGTELALCQRYCYSSYSVGGFTPFGFGYESSTTEGVFGIQFPVTMRANPTFTSSAASTFYVQDSGGNRVPSAMALQVSSNTCGSVTATITGGTTGAGAKLLDKNLTAYLLFSAEL